MKTIPKAFISYSHIDASFHEEFRKHLKPMEANQEIEIWSDAELLLGDELAPAIIRKLNEADVVIFLISVDFFNSKFIMNEEVKRTLENRKEKKLYLLFCVLVIGSGLQSACF